VYPIEQVELATLEWVWWWNNQRLHTSLGTTTPTETENTYYHQHQTTRAATATRRNQLGTKPSTLQTDLCASYRRWGQRVIVTHFIGSR